MLGSTISVLLLLVVCSGLNYYDDEDEYFVDHLLDTMPIFYKKVDMLERLHKEAENDPKKVGLIFDSYQHNCLYGDDVDPPEGLRRPFIVVEGNDRDSRKQITTKLSRFFGARVMGNPPQCLGPMVPILAKDFILKRVFFSFCLYVIAYNVKHLLNIGYPVVLNGYWHDQASFSIEKRFLKLPPKNHALYQFPDDLFRPDIIFYINKLFPDSNPQVRFVPLWKQRTTEVYKLFTNPEIHIINIDDNPEPVKDIKAIILEKLRGRFNLTYNPPRYLDPKYF
uniref:Uncharacterized protein n=1 Tax=Clastoptera arizonana TaxID=38151 RepID=A0A1B6CCD5_9HEMI